MKKHRPKRGLAKKAPKMRSAKPPMMHASHQAKNTAQGLPPDVYAHGDEGYDASGEDEGHAQEGNCGDCED